MKKKRQVLCKDDPLKAGDLAMNLLDGLLKPEQKDAIILDNSKDQILPGKLLEKVKISSLSKGTLTLKTNSSVWRVETLAQKASILAACNRILGKIAVKNIRVG